MSVATTRPRILRSELVKLLTLRSVTITLVVTAALPIGMASRSAPAVGRAITSNSTNLPPGITPETVGLSWIGLGLIGVIVVGVIAGSSEYTNHQVNTSLLSVPKRLQLVLTKSWALLLVTVGIGVTTIPALSIVSQIGLGELGVLDRGIPASLIWRWIGAIGLWVATAQIGFALALLLRQSLIPLFLMIVISQLSLALVYFFPATRYLPFAAGLQIYDPASITGPALSPVVAVSTLTGWTVVLLGLAIFRFRRSGSMA